MLRSSGSTGWVGRGVHPNQPLLATVDRRQWTCPGRQRCYIAQLRPTETPNEPPATEIGPGRNGLRRARRGVVPHGGDTRNTDDGQLCVRVEANDQDTEFSGQVLETYPGDSIAGFGSGNEDNQPIQFTDRHIHIVPHLL